MSHCRNSSRRIKYFYVVAFLSVWKNLPFPAANAPRRANRLFPCKPGCTALKKPPAQAVHYYASVPICTANSFLLSYLYKKDMNGAMQKGTFFRASMINNLYIVMQRYALPIHIY